MKTRLSASFERLVLSDGSRAHYQIEQVLLRAALSLGFLFLLCPLARAQQISGSYHVDRNKDQVAKLLELLQADRMQDVQKYFYGEDVIYDRDLADLFVFIDKTKGSKDPSIECLSPEPSVKFALIKREKCRKDLFGEKFVYIIVFVAEKGNDPHSVGELIPTNKRTITTVISDPSKKVTTEIDESTISPLSITQSSLDFSLGTGEFFLVSAIKAVAGASIGAQTKDEEIKEMLHEPLTMTRVGCVKDKCDKFAKEEDNTFLYFGYKRVALVENTVNRFTINETLVDKKGSVKKIYNHQATFGNYSSSFFGSSVGFTGTFISDKQRAELSDKRFPVNAFLFGHVYIKRPRLPTPHYLGSNAPGRIAKRCSLSLAVGTALKGNLLSDFFIGIGVGHLVGSFGLVAGYNLRTVEIDLGGTGADKKTEQKRKASLCVGLSFSL